MSGVHGTVGREGDSVAAARLKSAAGGPGLYTVCTSAGGGASGGRAGGPAAMIEPHPMLTVRIRAIPRSTHARNMSSRVLVAADRRITVVPGANEIPVHAVTC